MLSESCLDHLSIHFLHDEWRLLRESTNETIGSYDFGGRNLQHESKLKTSLSGKLTYSVLTALMPAAGDSVPASGCGVQWRCRFHPGIDFARFILPACISYRFPCASMETFWFGVFDKPTASRTPKWSVLSHVCETASYLRQIVAP